MLNIIKSKNGTLYLSKKDGYKAIQDASIKYESDRYVSMVLNDRYYLLEYHAEYYSIVINQTFISYELYNELTREYNDTFKDLKENREYYDRDEVDQIKGKLHYIATLLNKGRHQLERLKLIDSEEK